MRLSEKYKPLWTEDYRYAVISGGRGSAKSFTVQTFLRDLTYQPKHKIAMTRYTMTSAEKSVIPEFEEKLILDNVLQHFDLLGKTYTNNRSQSELYFMGLKTSSGVQTASLKSIHGLSTWYMEEAEELINDETEESECTFDKIDNSIRQKGVDLRTLLTWNPSDEESFVFQRFYKSRGVDITFNGLIDDTLYIYTSYLDNLNNLHPSFIKKAEEVKATNPARYNHIYMGKPIKSNPYALWKRDTMISPFRVNEAPDLKRIVVAVDPSVSVVKKGQKKNKPDECGIIVAGKGHNGHFYIIEDSSAIMSPKDWGLTSAAKYKDWEADKIVAEVNNGGQMVEDTIKNSDESLPVKQVHASRGKMVRAEPISALYESGKVHHVGKFPELEAEMVSFTGSDSDKSPNRLDAMVWALTELSSGETEVSFGVI